MDQIHKAPMFFEKDGLSHIETANYFTSIADANFLLQKPPHESPGNLKRDIDVTFSWSKKDRVRMRVNGILDICDPTGRKMNVGVKFDKVRRGGQPVDISDRKQLEVAIAIPA